jgi:hypothetical protein
LRQLSPAVAPAYYRLAVRRLAFAAVLACLFPSAAHAASARGDILLGFRLGASFADAFSPLSPSYVVAVESTYAPPIPRLRRRLAISLDASFTAPSTDGAASAPTLGPYTFHLEARQTIVSLSAVYRHPLVSDRLILFAGAGPRLLILDARLQSTTASTPPSRLPADHATSVAAAGGAFVGAALRAGPGEIFADVRLDAARVHNRLTGSFVAGAIFLAAGYRVLF